MASRVSGLVAQPRAEAAPGRAPLGGGGALPPWGVGGDPRAPPPVSRSGRGAGEFAAALAPRGAPFAREGGAPAAARPASATGRRCFPAHAAGRAPWGVEGDLGAPARPRSAAAPAPYATDAAAAPARPRRAAAAAPYATGYAAPAPYATDAAAASQLVDHLQLEDHVPRADAHRSGLDAVLARRQHQVAGGGPVYADHLGADMVAAADAHRSGLDAALARRQHEVAGGGPVYADHLGADMVAAADAHRSGLDAVLARRSSPPRQAPGEVDVWVAPEEPALVGAAGMPEDERVGAAQVDHLGADLVAAAAAHRSGLDAALERRSLPAPGPLPSRAFDDHLALQMGAAACADWGMQRPMTSASHDAYAWPGQSPSRPASAGERPSSRGGSRRNSVRLDPSALPVAGVSSRPATPATSAAALIYGA